MSSAARRLAVRFDEAIWHEAIRGFSRELLQVATSARLTVERRGIALADMLPCEAAAPDGTQLAGCAKLYLPLGDAPPSDRPFAFVLKLGRQTGRDAWLGLHRIRPPHPRPGVRSVYERAHRQIHGRFPGPG